MIINEPVNSPFNTVNAVHYSWIPEFQKEARDNIDSLLESIKYEATEVDHNSLYLDESLLYDMFKHNVEYDEYNANFIVLKYLNYYLQIKMLKYVSTGEWLFTTNDIEMLKYFANSTATCKRKLLRMNKKVDITVLHDIDVTDENTELRVVNSKLCVRHKYVMHFKSITKLGSCVILDDLTYRNLYDEWFGNLSSVLTSVRTGSVCKINIDEMFSDLRNYIHNILIHTYNCSNRVIISEAELNEILDSKEYATYYKCDGYIDGKQRDEYYRNKAIEYRNKEIEYYNKQIESIDKSETNWFIKLLYKLVYKFLKLF